MVIRFFIFIFGKPINFKFFDSMKKRIFSFIAILALAVASVSAQSGTKKLDPSGNWKFEAPYAPEGYTTGSIVVGMQEKVRTAAISFPGSDYNIPGEKVKFEGDSLRFEVYIDGSAIGIILKMESMTAMSGKAVTPDGEIPLTLKRESDTK